MLESDDADIGRAHGQACGIETPSTRLLAKGLGKDLNKSDELRLGLLKDRGRFPPVKPDTERFPRTEEEMKEEAGWLANKLAEMGVY